VVGRGPGVRVSGTRSTGRFRRRGATTGFGREPPDRWRFQFDALRTLSPI